MSSGDSIALVGGKVYPSPAEPPIEDATVLIREGTIAAVGSRPSVDVPSDLPRLDCSGRTILAGFWNSHVHFFERKWANADTIPDGELARQLRDMLTSYGFTSAFDTGSSWDNTRAIRDRIESGEVPGPRIYSTGEALLAKSAMPPPRILGVLGFMPFDAPEISAPSQAVEASRKLLTEGVDAIKIHLQPPPPPNAPFPVEAIAPTVDEAHRAGKPVFVHPTSGEDVMRSVEAGVDVIAHTTPGSGAWEEPLLRAMKQADVAVTPTLTLWRSAMRHDRASVQERFTRTAIDQLRAWVEIGGTALFGTDLGAVDYDPSGEYALMERAGMSFPQILESLTLAPATRFGHSDRCGRIAVGMQADLVAIEGDPTLDVFRLASVAHTWRAGRMLYNVDTPI